MTEQDTYTSYRTEEYVIKEEPFYLPVGDEVELFEVAYSQQMPVLLKGPTGTGKTRFVEYMSYRLGRPVTRVTKGRGKGKRESVAQECPVDDYCLPRGSHRQRPGGPVSPRRGRDPVDGRPPRQSRKSRGHMLPG